jgi:hypothetical protein
MTTETKHLFREQDVLDLISIADGANHCEIYARASVRVEEGSAVVELTSTLDIDCEEPPARFRVTVERIAGGA